MDIRPLSPFDRRKTIEKELDVDLSALSIDSEKLGNADQKNCENMFGCVPIPVGYAGPLLVTFSSGETREVHLPLATTEAALVASVNRGCKALRESGGVRVESMYHGVTRSIAFKMQNGKQHTCHAEMLRSRPSRLAPLAPQDDTSGNGASKHHKKIITDIHNKQHEWKTIGEATSKHLKILKYDIDTEGEYLFLTIYADTDEAMGMNMVTIAAQKIGEWIAKHLHLEFTTVAGNVDSDKKPSRRTHDRGRGYEVTATAIIPPNMISSILKSTPEAILEVARAKLDTGSRLAGALGKNLHAANIIAALYLATGQDAAHVVEGSLTDTKVEIKNPLSRREYLPHRGRIKEGGSRESGSDSIIISTRLPALLIGIRGGGTGLPAQSQCLSLLLKPKTSLHPCKQLAESIGAAVLAGELSLLATQAAHQLAEAHVKLARV